MKLDGRLLEAAADLALQAVAGVCQRHPAPLSKNGIVAGAMLVFIPAVGEFVIPSWWARRSPLMIGKVLWMEFSTTTTGRWRRR